MKPKKPLLRRSAGAVIVIALLVIPILAIRMADHRQETPVIKPVAPVTMPKPAEPAPVSAVSDQVILRPLPVSRRSASHEWTQDDATDPAVIEKIAHNPDEFIRLAEENDRIKRRQLVYRNETVPMLLERSRGSGRPLQTFILPGLDGREIEVEVTETRLAPGQQAGSVIGRVKGRFNSMVSVGFSNGNESFNVVSPDDNLYLAADAREPGEVMVKEIDLDEFTRPPGNAQDYILTGDQPPHQAPHTISK